MPVNGMPSSFVLPPRLRLDTASSLSLARALRDFGDGFAAVIMPVYLTMLGLGPAQIGIVATLALLGSASLTLLIGAYGNRFGERRLLLAASTMMLLTGIGFALVADYVLILPLAFVGTLNPGAGNTSAFVPPEHSWLSRSVTDEKRTTAFARYGLIGSMAGAAGSLAAGSPELLAGLGIGKLTAFKAMFLLYGALGIGVGIVYASLPAVEHGQEQAPAAPLGASRGIVLKLAALFSIDAFASGFMVQSLLALFLFERFGLSLTSAGLFFFWSGVLSAFSQPIAAYIARRIGLVNTMVFTHIPANVFLILGAIVPSLPLALTFLLIRAFLSQMDVPARSSYVMAVVTPPERTAAASFTAVPRSLAAALSPAIAGAMMAMGLTVWPLVICGALKIVYDVALLWAFSHIKPPEEQGGNR